MSENNANNVAKEDSSVSSYVIIQDYGGSIIQKLKNDFTKIAKESYPEADDVPIVIVETNNPNYGDYQFNSSIALSKKLNSKTTPIDIAKTLKEKFPESTLVDKVEVAEPGFINVFLNRQEIGRRISEIYRHGVDVTLPKVEKRKAIVDFSSPNIAKAMHVGHLRSTIIGDSICRLFELIGFDVLPLNHIGDWGTQFGMLIAHLQDEFPSYLTETPPIGDLLKFYKESKIRFDEDRDFKQRAYQCVVKLQNFDEDIVKAWKLICDVSREDFQRIYKRLDISIIERGESFYQSRMIDLAKELEENGKLIVDDGRKILFTQGISVPLTIVERDGGYTYDTSDIASLKQRLFEEKADWIIYVVDDGQSLHFETIFGAGRDLGYYDPKEKRVEYVGFGLICGEDKKIMKTREGKAIKLNELFDESIKRAKAKMEAKRSEKSDTYDNMTDEDFEAAYHAVAYSAIKYADLSQNHNSVYVFSFDRMLDDRGNTAVYLLYAYARIRSISRKAGLSKTELLTYLDQLQENNEPFPLEHAAEFKLAKQILMLSDCILTAMDSLLINQICDYVYTLATTFHDFYNECYVIHNDREGNTVLFKNRLVLCEVTADVMAVCFKTLGLSVVEKM